MQVTLTLNSTFQLPFSSAFPMATPSLELYVMMVCSSRLFILKSELLPLPYSCYHPYCFVKVSVSRALCWRAMPISACYFYVLRRIYLISVSVLRVQGSLWGGAAEVFPGFYGQTVTAYT